MCAAVDLRFPPEIIVEDFPFFLDSLCKSRFDPFHMPQTSRHDSWPQRLRLRPHTGIRSINSTCSSSSSSSLSSLKYMATTPHHFIPAPCASAIFYTTFPFMLCRGKFIVIESRRLPLSEGTTFVCVNGTNWINCLPVHIYFFSLSVLSDSIVLDRKQNYKLQFLL